MTDSSKIIDITKEIVIAMLPSNWTYLADEGTANQVAKIFETIYNKVSELYGKK